MILDTTLSRKQFITYMGCLAIVCFLPRTVKKWVMTQLKQLFKGHPFQGIIRKNPRALVFQAASSFGTSRLGP